MRGFILLLISSFAYGVPLESDPDACGACYMLMGEVQTMVADGATQEAVMDYAGSVCRFMSSEDKDVCNLFLQIGSVNVFEHLVADLKPQYFCQEIIKVCPHEQEIHNGVVDVVSRPVEEFPPVMRSESLDDNVEDKGLLECELCKLAILAVDKLIKNNKSEAAINSTLEKFCQSLPNELSAVCLQLEPKIMEAIINGADPDTACKLVKLCTLSEPSEPAVPCSVCEASLTYMGVQNVKEECMEFHACVVFNAKIDTVVAEKEQESEKDTLEDSLECQICKFVVVAIDKLVDKNASVAEINQTLISLCNGLPGELKDACLNVEPEVLKALINGIDPTKACDFIKACHDNTPQTLMTCAMCKEVLEAIAGEDGVEACYEIQNVCSEQDRKMDRMKAPVLIEQREEPEEITQVEDDAKCELCQLFVAYIDQIAEDPSSLAKLNSTLHEACNLMPAEFKATCNSLVPLLLSAIGQGVDPSKACTEIKFCQNAVGAASGLDLSCSTCQALSDLAGFSEEMSDNFCRDKCSVRVGRSLMAIQTGNVIECEICHILVLAIDNIAKENATRDKVNNTIYEICIRLTGKDLEDVCMEAAPKIMAVLDKGVDPKVACKTANICPSTDMASGRDARKVQEAQRKIKSRIHMKSKPLPPVHDDLKCILCEELVKVADIYIAANQTFEKLNQTLFEVCDAVPDETFKMICQGLIPQILNVIQKGVNPLDACKALKMCTSQDTEKRVEILFKMILGQLVEKSVTPQPNDLKCELCEELIKFLDKLVAENESEAKINETLNKICGSLPDATYKALCKTLIPQILTVVEKGVDPVKACTDIKLCAAIVPIVQSQQVSSPNDLKCELCEELVTFLDKVIEENATVEKINATLFKICQSLPAAYKDMCELLIPELLKMAGKGIDPKTACTDIKVCTQDMPRSKLMFILGEGLFQVKDSKLDINLKCDLCKAVIEEIDTIIGKNATKEKINSTVYEECERMGGTFKDLCLEFAPQIVAVITSGVDPSEACQKVGLCPSTGVVEAVDVTIESEPEDMVEHAPNDLKCELCQDLITEIDKYVDQNSTLEQINKTIYATCMKLPGALQDICLQFAPQLVHIIASGVDPKEACQKIGICPKQGVFIESEPEDVVAAPAPNDLKCDLCQDLITEIEKYVDQNSTLEQINKTIYAACMKLPGALQDICLQFAPQLVHIIASGVDPKEACQKIGLCPKQEVFMESEPEGIVVAPAPNDLKCDLCQDLITEIDKYVDQNSTLEQINKTIYATCMKLPGALQDICLQFAPQLVSIIAGGVDPKEACQKIGICPKLEVQIPEKAPEVPMTFESQCDACEYMVELIETHIKMADTTTKKSKIISSACAKLNGYQHELCIEFAPAILKAMEEGVGPAHVCTYINLCKSKDAVVVKPLLTPVRGLGCEDCDQALKGLQREMMKDFPKVKMPLAAICQQFPAQYKDKCLGLVSNESYLKRVFELYSPTALCEMAHCGEEQSVRGENISG